MRNFIAQGDFLTVTTTKELQSGDLFVEGSLVGVCTTDSNTEGFSIATGGVFLLKKDPTKEILLGQKVYSKDGAPLTTTSTDSSYVGVCLGYETIKATTVKVRLG